MTDNSNEQLSAFFDGEFGERDADRVMARLARDEELTSCWDRYQLIGDAIRGQLPHQVSRDLASRVDGSIRDEPPILAPQRSTSHRFLRPAAGVALAASVAGAALLLFPVADENPGLPERVAARPAPQQVIIAAPGIRWSAGEPAVASKLNRYLVNHNEFARSRSIKGVLRNATLVGYEQGR